MRGTWQTDGGSGLAAVAVAGAAAGAGVIAAGFVLARIWWVVAVVVVSGVLSVAAVLWLWRWSGRQTARVWAHRPAQLRAEPAARVPAAERPAIGPVYNFNFYGPAGDTHAAVIRKAITGTAGDAATERK